LHELEVISVEDYERCVSSLSGQRNEDRKWESDTKRRSHEKANMRARRGRACPIDGEEEVMGESEIYMYKGTRKDR
jgi:hypothetical protein